MNCDVVDILGVKVSAVTPALSCQLIDNWIVSRKKVYLCVAPVSTIVEAQKDFAYKEVLNNAALVTPDGMPLVWIGRSRGNKVIQRTYGPDLMRSLCDYGQTKGYRHYLYGATQETLEMLEGKLKVVFPNIKIAGKYPPPFRGSAELEEDRIVRGINDSQADILWVGIGSPKQDFWMVKHRAILNPPVMIGIGAAFDFLSGRKPQAPRWMQRSGLEWLFRLCWEPQRLWRRYLIGNSLFVLYFIKDCFRKKRD